MRWMTGEEHLPVPTVWSFKASELIAEYPALKRWHAHIYALLLKSFPGTAYGKAFPADEAAADAMLKATSYVTMHQPSIDDFMAFNAMAAKPSAPNTLRWYKHITALVAARFPGASAGRAWQQTPETIRQTALPLKERVLVSVLKDVLKQLLPGPPRWRHRRSGGRRGRQARVHGGLAHDR